MKKGGRHVWHPPFMRPGLQPLAALLSPRPDHQMNVTNSRLETILPCSRAER
jgi:hypothetical protein